MTPHPRKDAGHRHTGVSDKRAYFRVPTWLVVHCQVIDRTEAESLEVELLANAPLDPSELDPGLAAWLGRIEDKLDRLLAHLDPDSYASIASEDPQEVQLSGAGMLFEVKEEVPPEATLALEFALPGAPGRRVRCLAEIAEQQGQTPGPLAVYFAVIHERDRDAIVRHVLEVQRGQIRARGGEDECP